MTDNERDFSGVEIVNPLRETIRRTQALLKCDLKCYPNKGMFTHGWRVGAKPLDWVGSAKKDFMAFPGPVKDDMGNALGLAQFGGMHPSAKPWKGQGPGVFEFVESHDGNAYRAVYTVRFAEVVYVLHTFQKKSPSGVRTAQGDVDLIGRRLKVAQQDYEDRYGKTRR